jgi:hypothetical protein
MSARKGKARIRVGQRVYACVPGTIEEIKRGIVYVRIVVRNGQFNDFGTAVCYRDELRKERAK